MYMHNVTIMFRACIFYAACCLCLVNCTSLETSPIHSDQQHLNSTSFDTENSNLWLETQHKHIRAAMGELSIQQRINNALHLSEETYHQVAAEVPIDKTPLKQLSLLSDYLLSLNGRGMQYDLSADFTAEETFQQGRANCLSFTLLLVALAKQRGIDVEFNQVEIPEVWDEIAEDRFRLYRHINAVYRPRKLLAQRKHVFDLAIEEYDFSYPQFAISEQSAVAQHYNNLAMNAFSKNDRLQALRLSRIALGMDINSADLWSNYGSVLRRYADQQDAEQAFLHALTLDKNHALAASNLASTYQMTGRHQLAKKYQTLVNKSRYRNPYFLFSEAEKHYQHGRYNLALKMIRKAIRLHDNEHRFYHLQGNIYFHLNKYIQAGKSYLNANTVARSQQDKQRYAQKINRLVAIAEVRQ